MSEQRPNDPKGDFRCPYCGIAQPHHHYADRKGYIRGIHGEVLGRVPEQHKDLLPKLPELPNA